MPSGPRSSASSVRFGAAGSGFGAAAGVAALTKSFATKARLHKLVRGSTEGVGAAPSTALAAGLEDLPSPGDGLGIHAASSSVLEDPTGWHPVHGSASGGEVTFSEEPSSAPQQRKAKGGSSAADLRAESQREASGSGAADLRAQSQRETGGSDASELRALLMLVEQMQRSMAEMQATMTAMAGGQMAAAPLRQSIPTEAGSGSGSGSGEATAVRGPSELPTPADTC